VFCCDAALQGRRFRAAERGVLGSGLIMEHLYYGVPLHGRSLKESIRFRVDNGPCLL
jgi:hypothetical protein